MDHMTPAMKQWPGVKLTSSGRKSFVFQDICMVPSSMFVVGIRTRFLATR